MSKISRLSRRKNTFNNVGIKVKLNIKTLDIAQQQKMGSIYRDALEEGNFHIHIKSRDETRGIPIRSQDTEKEGCERAMGAKQGESGREPCDGRDIATKERDESPEFGQEDV